MKFQHVTPRVCAALFALLFTAFACATARAQASTMTTNENIPFTSSLFNPCNSDQVTFSGTLHVVNTMTTDASGGTHLKTHLNYQDVTGTGVPSGITYNVRTVTNEVINDNDGPQSEMTVISTVKMVARGPALDYYMRTVIHITVNANGETTSTVQEVSIECRGRN
ncbi:MAG: hypothetical protein JOZ96_27385 [Acidobacteria bacterium]|nr:hypothetical protein [Acidobacteriota bacterium]